MLKKHLIKYTTQELKRLEGIFIGINISSLPTKIIFIIPSYFWLKFYNIYKLMYTVMKRNDKYYSLYNMVYKEIYTLHDLWQIVITLTLKLVFLLNFYSILFEFIIERKVMAVIENLKYVLRYGLKSIYILRISDNLNLIFLFFWIKITSN